MNINKSSFIGLMLISVSFVGNACAGMDEDVFQLQKSWEKIKYQMPITQ